MLIHSHLLLIPIVLLVAAFFAAAEAALFSLTQTQLQALQAERPLLHRRIKSLISPPDTLLTTIIIGNECLSIALGTLVATLMEFHFGNWNNNVQILASVLVASLLLLTTSEILPKILGFRLPILMSSIVVFPMQSIQWILTPFRKIFRQIAIYVVRLMGINITTPAIVSERDFLTLVELGEESGSLAHDEKQMILNVFHFGDLMVSHIMTPWDKVLYFSENEELDTIINRVRTRPYSRIPMLSQANQVVGVLYTKDILQSLLSPARESHRAILQQAIHPPFIVSRHHKVSNLFREFKQKKIHAALVVDEFGKHLGIVSLEDILNALFSIKQKAENLKSP